MEREALYDEDSTVDYESKDGRDASEYQLRWINVMNKGNYNCSENYNRVEVLLLRWDDTCDDMTTRHEVGQLKNVFEKEFNWHTELHCLNNKIEGRLQLQINAIVAAWVNKYSKPNTLLVVYYAGHGRPGTAFGQLELMGQSSPNDNKRKRLNSIVWNKTEELLKPAEADVLEIFDCCYAGTVGLARGIDRRFEYLAATTAMGTSPVPGPDSFTTALIWALRKLKQCKAGGRFTTDELVREIKHQAPNFPEDQKPVLSDRDYGNRAGRIILSPLSSEDLNGKASPVEEVVVDLKKRHCMTLHLDFAEKPSFDTVEKFGEELNNIFERRAFGVHRVRLGGVKQSLVVQAVDRMRKLRHKRKQSESQDRLRAPGLDLPTPSPSRQLTPQFRPLMTKSELTSQSSDPTSIVVQSRLDFPALEMPDPTPKKKRRRIDRE
ncbi:MAG: hypothetical protein Q9203_006505 [Teloschistes exilis]